MTTPNERPRRYNYDFAMEGRHPMVPVAHVENSAYTRQRTMTAMHQLAVREQLQVRFVAEHADPNNPGVALGAE